MLFNLLFPRRCLGCGQEGNYFCQECLLALRLRKPLVCPVCQKPVIEGRTHSRCSTKYSLDGLISVFAYQGIIRQAIGKLKYRFVTDLAKELIDLTTKHLAIPFKSQTPITLIPIPLHSRRQRWRGFNQAELLGKLLAKELGWNIRTDILVRSRHTKPQVELKGKKRKTNIKGVFQLKTGFEKPKSKIVLFDDVWTTGSTLKEAGRILKRAGVKEVWGLTLAR
jgi:ComF family protein